MRARLTPPVCVEWEQIAFMRPPWRPTRNINMASQSEIGTFNGTRICFFYQVAEGMRVDEKDAKRVVLLPEDHRNYETWDFLNKKAFEEEVVEYLRCEEQGRITGVSEASGCCSIS